MCRKGTEVIAVYWLSYRTCLCNCSVTTYGGRVNLISFVSCFFLLKDLTHLQSLSLLLCPTIDTFVVCINDNDVILLLSLLLQNTWNSIV